MKNDHTNSTAKVVNASSSDNVDQSSVVDEEKSDDIKITYIKTYETDENGNFNEYQPFELVPSSKGLRQRKATKNGKSELNESLAENVDGVDAKGFHDYNLLKLEGCIVLKYKAMN